MTVHHIKLIESVLLKAYNAKAITFRDYDYCKWLLAKNKKGV